MPIDPAAASLNDAPPPAAGLTPIEERVARGVVAKHRQRLDWMLRVPEWEELFREGLIALELPGPRQGIGFDAALLALPLENKFELVRWTLPRFRRHLPSATGRRLCRLVGVESFSTVDLESCLSLRQWQRLREGLLARLGQEHRRYKHAQQLLFTGYRALVDRIVAQSVFHAHHRADCVQEGALGLLHAIDRVDDSADNLAAYAGCWIRRHVRNFLLRQRLPVQAPHNLVSRALALAAENPAATDGAPDADETEARASRSAAGDSRMAALLLECLRHPAVSFDEPAAERPGALSLAEVVADAAAESPAEAAAKNDARATVRRFLTALTDKQREVLIHRFGLGERAARTVVETARLAGISHQQVCMRERRALERLETVLLPVMAELGGV